MEFYEAMLLIAAAFVAGSINAVAGGGTLITFPSLVAVGYSAKVSNVTNTIAVWPGTVGGSYAYRSELGRQRRRVAVLAAPSLLGALAGSALLLSTPGDTFEDIVPFLILFAAGTMFFQEQLSAFAAHHKLVSQGEHHEPAVLLLAVFLTGVYGAYFGAAYGIITLALFAILLPDDIQHSNALKGLLAMLVNGLAVVYFALFGPVEWAPGLLMGAGSLAGGFLGVGIARRLGPVWLRRAVVAYGVVVAVVMLVT
jgi:uncharacterized membrane protein YfcA